MLLEVAGRDARHERRPDVEELDRHRVAVGEAQALDGDDWLGRRDVEDAAQPGAGGDLAQVERTATGRKAPRAHVVAERRDVDALRDLRLGDERTGTAPAHEVSLAHELVERRAHGQPGDAEVDPELSLRRDRIADAERLDQLEHALAGLALLCQAWPAPVHRRVSSRAPVSGSK